MLGHFVGSNTMLVGCTTVTIFLSTRLVVEKVLELLGDMKTGDEASPIEDWMVLAIAGGVAALAGLCLIVKISVPKDEMRDSLWRRNSM
jgi:hypothetical protein